MKFNERNVSYYASCNSPIDKEGILLKRRELNRGYQRRWFILKGNLLFYFEKKGDKDPIGVIILEGCRIELSDSEDSQYTFQISFPGEGARTYILAAYSQQDMETWMRALSCSSYDYMKAMVDELQRQLDELTHDSHGDGHIHGGRFSYAMSGQSDSQDMEEIPHKLGIYDRGKTESLSHQGAPRQNAFVHRNSVPVAQFSNPSYAIWDPLIHAPEKNTTAQTSILPDNQLEVVEGELIDQSVEVPSMNQPPESSRSNTRSVFYENISASPQLVPRSGTTRARFFNKSQCSAAASQKSTQAMMYHERDVRSFSEMHAEFGMLIVKKVNEHRQRKMSSSSSSSSQLE